MNKNQTQNPLKANQKNQKKDKLKAKLKKKLQQVKESGSTELKNVEKEAEKRKMTNTKGAFPKPKAFKFDNDERSMLNNNKHNKQSKAKPPKSQHEKQTDKLTKNQKKPLVHLATNKVTKNNESKPVAAKDTKKESGNNKQEKKKKKKKNKLIQKLNPTKPLKRHTDDIETTGAKKRMKTVNGFVEIDANDQEGIQLAEKKMQKKKSKLEQIKKKQTDVGPPVIVHTVPEKELNSETNSDSEDDSYIDKFFSKNDEEFDENRVYSQDEIESKKVNGFLSKDSEDGLSSDDDASSDDDQSEENQFTKYEHQSDDDLVDSDEFDYYGSDTDDSNNDVLFHDDSDISLGSEVQSDENKGNDDSYISLGSEVQSDENEMNDDSNISLGSEVQSDENKRNDDSYISLGSEVQSEDSDISLGSEVQSEDSDISLGSEIQSDENEMNADSDISLGSEVQSDENKGNDDSYISLGSEVQSEENEMNEDSDISLGSEIQSDENEMNDDSDISLGSEVQSDENEMNYGFSFESSSDEEEAYSQDYSDDDADSDDSYSYSEGSDSSNENDQSDDSSDTYDNFMHGNNYDSDDDHEYKDKAYDDVRIAPGTAITYNVEDLRIKVFKNDNKSRIIEIPKSATDDDECPTLVPIGMKKKKLEKIEKFKILTEKIKIEAMKLQTEQQKLEYENRIKDYYKMGDKQRSKINTGAKHQTEPHFNDSNISNKSYGPLVIKVPKEIAKTLSIIPQLKNDNDIVMNDTCSTLPFPKVKPEQCVIGTIIDETDTDDMIDEKSISNSSFDCETDQVQEMELQSEMNSSFVENENAQETISPNVPLSKAAQIIKGKPKFFNSLNSRHVLLLLRNVIYFHGSLTVKLIAGNATVFGYELEPNKSVTVHSPKSHSLIYIIPNPNKKTKHDLSCLNRLKSDFYQQDLILLSEEFDGSTDAILMLERDKNNKGVNMIERYMRETIFPNVNAFNNESPHYSSEFVLHCKFSYRPKHGLILNNEWSSVQLKSNSKLVTIGGKGVGKSTFVRYMINSNFIAFQKFLFIDLDIGQPELFVPQTLSVTVLCEPVLGPGYLRNIKPAKSVLFGDVNVLPDPIKYLRCVIEIAKFCSSNAEYQNIPWIINTMGYSRGFGNELMACILNIFQPTDLVQIQSRSHLDNFDRIIDAHFVNTFKFNVFEEELQNIQTNCNFKTHVFNTICNDDKGKQKQIDFTAKDFRYTNILANLGNCLKCNSDWLTSVKPSEASLNDLKIIICSGEEVKESQYMDILNGNLVYLCQTHDENTANIADCYGIGIVRSVDVATNKIYLLSTIPLNELCNVNALAIGAIPLPSAVFLNQPSQIHGTVPYVYNTDNFVGSKQVAQHIFRSETNRKNKPIELMDQ